MSDFSSCLLQHYGVLPGPPSRVRMLMVSTTYAVLSWQSPKILPDTVIEYHVNFRKLNDTDDKYKTVKKVGQTIIIEGLESDSEYEVFVVSLNVHGKSAPSPRLIFRTESLVSV